MAFFPTNYPNVKATLLGIKDGVVTSALREVLGVIEKLRDHVANIINENVALEGGGTGTINSGSTAAVITHGLSRTPLPEEIWVTFTESPTTDPGNIWVSTITATQFTVNCRTNPGASNLDFSWGARLRLST